MKDLFKYGWPALLIALLLVLTSCRAETTTSSSVLSTSSVPPTSTPAQTTSPPSTSSTPTPVSPITTLLPGPEQSKLGTVERDVTYGTGDGIALKMDIYYPKTASKAVPVAVYVHGGGWTQGDKAAGAGTLEISELVKRGYLVTAVNYRLAPDYKFPAQIEDVKCAVRFLRANASAYGIDPEKIGAWGGSAGGHLVSLLGTSDAGAGLEGSGGYPEHSSRVRAVVNFFGPSDITALFQDFGAPMLIKVFDTFNPDSPKAVTASPVTYISPDDPPFLIVHGIKDVVVPIEQSQELYERLTAAGVPATLIVVKNGGHGFAPTSGTISPTRAEITEAVADFFDKYLK